MHDATPLLDFANSQCAQFGAIALAYQFGGLRPRRIAKIG
jgi:hypothetical protein